MPTLSASEYTQYLKFKASAGSAIRPAIQTRDNVATSQSLINANLLASQAAFVTTPATTVVTQNAATVTDATTAIVTAARTDVLTLATGGTDTITYTASQAHGLAAGDLVTISGFGTGITGGTANQTTALAVQSAGLTATAFRLAVSGVTGGSATGPGSLGGRVYYTTSIANGLAAGDVISITGVTTFTASGATVLAVPSTALSTFVLSSATTGTAVAGQSGSITGLVYYTTNIAHGIFAGTPYVSITGLTGTPAYNQTLTRVYRVPSTTTFVMQSSATGTAVTGGSGVLTITLYPNQNMAVTGLARVQGQQVVQTRSNPDARSTVSYAGTSGALSSSRVQQPGGLPRGFKSSTSTYTRLPQQAGW
jgi:hypothetical protein